MGLYVLLDHDGEQITTALSLAEAARVAVEDMGDNDIEIQYHYWKGEGQETRKQVDFEGYAGEVYDELGLEGE